MTHRIKSQERNLVLLISSKMS